jgi:hypothetical protein
MSTPTATVGPHDYVANGRISAVAWGTRYLLENTPRHRAQGAARS